MRWLTRARSVLHAEVDAVRRGEIDPNPADLTRFTFPLLLRLSAIIAFGAVPLMVVRGSVQSDEVLVPLLASLALTGVCGTVVTWLICALVSGLVLVVFYRAPAARASRTVIGTVVRSFERITNTTALLTTLALSAGLIAVAIGLPKRPDHDQAHSVLDDLFAAQAGVLLAGLAFAYLSEAIRCTAEIINKHSLLLGWPWSLVITLGAWVIATTVGPFQASRLLVILLEEWLPAVVNGIPRAQAIAEAVPSGATWLVALAPLPVIALIWALEAHHHKGFKFLQHGRN
ncbi:hypothetical protein [Mycolicibacterium phlei]|uniref:hypothetical protein n=1 Tax=Mycolicibacterium phlei TaxID=1771 RepID=UPI0037C6B586